MLPGLKSAAAIHRPSVRPEGRTKTRYSSGPEAPIVYDSLTFRTRSGGPSAQSDVQTFGGGASFGLPSGAPASAQSARVFRSRSFNTRAPRKGPPSVVEACQGG